MNSLVSINGVNTPIITFGRSMDDDLSDINYIVLIFTGNPGVIEFYRDFMEALYGQITEKNLGQEIPVWGTSHAGHQIISESSLPNPIEHPDLYNLDGQVEHKMKLIQKYIPKHIKIIGIGHSVGAKIWSEVFRRDCDIEKQVAQCYMLFPSLERIGSTPNGRRLDPILRLRTMIIFLLLPILYLPDTIKTFFVQLFFRLRTDKLSPCIIPATLRLLNPTSVKNCADLARSEFEQILDLDVNTLKKSIDKIYIYFGATDDWCPLEYVENVKQKVPAIRHKICDKGLTHAFVVKSSIEMATILTTLNGFITDVIKPSTS